MSSSRRRSSRPQSSRRPTRDLETLESRQLLAQSPYVPIDALPIRDFPAAHDPGRVPGAIIDHPIGSNPALLATYQNQGKILSGQDRQGNRYQLTLTGPGTIILTDTTPNDGVLDDDLDTIRLVGTTNQSVLTGVVVQSQIPPQNYTQLPTLGEVKFNRLIADSAVKRITLNGFVLTDTINTVAGVPIIGATNLNATTGINLRGGVGRLEFQGIDAALPASYNPSPIIIQIGSPTTPLSVHPDIRIDSINNTVYDDTAFNSFGTGTGLIPTGPLTSPSVQLVVNGALASFNVVSITQETNVARLNPAINNFIYLPPVQLIPDNSAALQYQFPIVGTTGRTSVQATAIRHIRASGNVTNTTFSKSTRPFENSLTGLDNVGDVQIGGTADAVAIDSRGSIHSLTFAKSAGSPVGVSNNPIYYGTPADRYGYPHNGNVGVQVVTEGSIGSIKAAPVDRFTQTTQDPAKIQSGLNGTQVNLVRPGTAVQSSVVVANGSIGKTHVVGDLRNSQIASGSNYYSTVNGIEGVTGASKIGPAKIRGDLVDTVVAASYRSNDGIYGNGNDSAGDGTITGTQAGTIYATSTGATAAGTRGSGFFSRFTTAHPRRFRRK